MTDLTIRQKQFLDFITGFVGRAGYPPSIREMQQHFRLKSTKGVKDHVDRLVEKGYLQRENGSARALSLTARAGSGRRWTDSRAPIVGNVAAGLPILAQENIQGSLPLPERYAGREGMFWLRVRGDSMTGDGIFHGDLVLVLPQPFVEQNQIAVVMVDCDATVKRFRREGNVVKLVPGNPDYPVMEYRREDGEVSVVGRVVALYREFEGS